MFDQVIYIIFILQLKNRSWEMKSLSENGISAEQNHKETKMFALRSVLLTLCYMV